MTVDAAAHLSGTADRAVDAFTFNQTLPRGALNRRAVSEVFLTDFHPIDEEAWILGAQLPLNHAYYTDHIAEVASYDLLLLLECCRQAATYGGYFQLGKPADTINLVNSLSIDIFKPEYLKIGAGPSELVIRIVATEIVRAGNNMRAVTPIMELFFGQLKIGEAHMPATFASPAQFRALRARRRGSAPPLTDTLRDVPVASKAAPVSVGRLNPMNVVIGNVCVSDEGATADFTLSPGNRSILDHEYDHIPAMALVEAARQLGFLLLPDTESVPVAIRASFFQFAEVDVPITLRASLKTDDAGRHESAVDCVQGDEVIVQVFVGYAAHLPIQSRQTLICNPDETHLTEIRS